MPTPPIDLQIVLSILYPGVNCGPMAGSLNTYAELSAHWPAANGACPTLETLQAKWNEYLANPIPYMPVPQIVSRWRLRRALRATPFNGSTLFQVVTDAITASGDIDLAEQWEDVTEIVRTSAVIAKLSVGLNIPPELVDDVFRLAESYPQ